MLIYNLFPHRFVEKGLSRAEADIANTLKQIDKNHNCLYEDDVQIKLIIFLHDLAFRTEAYRNQTDNISNQLRNHLLRLGIDPTQVKGLCYLLRLVTIPFQQIGHFLLKRGKNLSCSNLPFQIKLTCHCWRNTKTYRFG